jgi:hypothetical protein
MASIKLIPEEEATGKVREIYEQIKSRLGIDFVPNLYRAMAATPTTWRRTGTGYRRLWSKRGNSIS